MLRLKCPLKKWRCNSQEKFEKQRKNSTKVCNLTKQVKAKLPAENPDI